MERGAPFKKKTFHQTAAHSHGSSSVAEPLSTFPEPTHRRLTGECKGGELARQRSCDDGAEAVRKGTS